MQLADLSEESHWLIEHAEPIESNSPDIGMDATLWMQWNILKFRKQFGIEAH